MARQLVLDGAKVRVTDVDGAAVAALPDRLHSGVVDVTGKPAMAVFPALRGARSVCWQAMTVDGFTINPDAQV